MKNSLLILFLFCLSTTIFAQNPWTLKEYSNWVFGQQNMLTFNTNSSLSSKKFTGSYSAYESCASISDSLGNLLFATNGYHVIDKNGAFMDGGNGTLLAGCEYNSSNVGAQKSSSTQGTIIVKHPLNDSLYYIFTADDALSEITKGFNYAIVNIKKNDGLGKVEKIQRLKNNKGQYFRTTEQCAVTLHQNGTDIWVVTHESGTRKLLAYLLKKDGVDTLSNPIVSYASDSNQVKSNEERSFLEFSWDSKLACSSSYGRDNASFATTNLILYQFNNASGIFTRKTVIRKNYSDNRYAIGSMVFSPENKRLYRSMWNRGGSANIESYDVSDLTDSVKIYNSRKGFYISNNSAAIKMGSDGYIYLVIAYYGAFLHKIHRLEGDLESSDVTLKQNIHTLPYEPTTGLPLMFAPKANPKKEANFTFTKNKTVIKFNNFSYFGSNYHWDFGDGTTSTEKSPSHSYMVDGKYNVCLIASGTNWADTLCKEVESWYRKISGIAYSDENNNGIKDAGEKGNKGLKITLTPDNAYYATYTNDSGYYEAFVYDATLLFNIEIQTPKFNQITQPNSGQYSNLSVNLNQSLLLNKHFGLHKNLFYDTESRVVTNWARPGFKMSCYVESYNNGSITADEIEQILIFDPRLTPINLPPGFEQRNDSIIYVLHNVYSTLYHSARIDFKIPSNMSLGEELLFISIAKIESNDTDTINNIDSCFRIVTGAYDPNLKESSFGNDSIDLPVSEMEYTIHFQNTGTDTAFTVIVQDSLDVNIFDYKSITMISSSHDYTFAAKANGVATWTFNNILLPDSNINEAGSHGYLQFKISTKPVLSEGMTIKNRAFIYFDFNIPVITDYANNTINLKTATLQINPSEIMIFPNPADELLFVKIPNYKNNILTVTDVTGKEVYAEKNVDNTCVIDISKFPQGIYLLSVFNQESRQSVKFIVE